MSERTYRSYKRDLVKINNKKFDGTIMDYEEAEKEIVDYLSEKKKLEFDTKQVENVIKTKDYLREKKLECRRLIVDCIYQKNISVRGYPNEKIEDFIEEMVAEYAGYSILEDAFADPDINDIYCIDWETIFVEKKNKNIPYHKKFRSKEHYKNVVERFIREAGKEINWGDRKIVDFELYGDRGCAISPAVTPRDYCLTIRKHKEEHITLDEIIDDGIMSEEMSEFFGLIIDGEANLIYAGITGTGKTTTIRALIDYYITRNGKRMLVCEDTQELFPKNKHTVEMVAFKSDDPILAVPLHKLVITALRLKPRYIIVGEVRGEEAQAAVEAMETGHSTIFTMHGGTPWNIINRLVTKYLMCMPSLGIDVVERIIGEAVDYMAIQDHIPEFGRFISGIYEISYDFIARRVKIEPIFQYDFYKKDFVLVKRIAKEKAHKLLRRGIPLEVLDKWIDTGDPEKEKKFIDEFNEKYFSEKPQRMEIYKQRKAERERQREERRRAEILAKTGRNMELEGLNKAVINETLKNIEIEDMIKRTEVLKQKLSAQESNE